MNKLQDTIICLNNNLITTVNLRDSNISVASAIALAEALKINRSVTAVNISLNQIGDVGITAIAEALKVNDSITAIDLEYNQIGAAGADAIADALKNNSSVKTLILWGNEIGNAGVTALAEALKINVSVTTVDIRDNNVDDAGAIALARALKVNSSVTALNLWGNQIGDNGIAALAKALELNSTITSIYLGLEHCWGPNFKNIATKLKANAKEFEITIDYVKLFIKQVVQSEETDFSSVRSKLRLPSISLKNCEYIIKHKTNINKWLIKEISEYGIAITINKFWQLLEASKNTAPLEQGIFDIMDLHSRHNVIVSNFYPYAEEAKELYELFIVQSRSKVGTIILKKNQVINKLDQFKYQYNEEIANNGDFTTLWKEFITYAGKLLSWSKDKVDNFKLLRNISMDKSVATEEDQYSMINKLKKSILFHSLNPQYEDIGLVIKDFFQEIIQGLQSSEPSIEAYNLVESLRNTILAEDTNEAREKILSSVYESRLELFTLKHLESLIVQDKVVKEAISIEERQKHLAGKNLLGKLESDRSTEINLNEFQEIVHNYQNTEITVAGEGP